MSVRLDVNFSELGSTLEAMASRVGLRSGSILKEQAEQIMTESKQQCPVDTGALRASAFVDVEKGMLKSTVTFGYDGKTINTNSHVPSSTYMVAVHENLSAHHPVGKAKFLEDPVNEYAAKFESSLGSKIANLFKR